MSIHAVTDSLANNPKDWLLGLGTAGGTLGVVSVETLDLALKFIQIFAGAGGLVFLGLQIRRIWLDIKIREKALLDPSDSPSDSGGL